ncbi:MAG TPA: DUF4388 domain-containing protein [Thermoanaerobaculia bacterium]|jgi:hypothetical protein
MNLEGDISEIQLVERLVDLWREQFTGAIRFENDGIIKIIYFKGGDVLSASTNDRSDSIDEILMRAGKVSREHVKQALAKRKENETLGDALLNLGFITRKELTWSRRVQVVGVIRSIAAWPTGSFTIVADYLPKRDEGTLFPLPQILVELIVTEADRQRFERAMDGGTAVFTKSADFDDVFRRLGLNEEAESIVAQVDGESTAAEVALSSGKDTFNVYKLLDALATLRILQRTAKPQVEPQVVALPVDDDLFSGAGVADAADLWNDPPPPPVELGDQPINASGPQFELDEADAFSSPTLEVPGLSIPPESDYQPPQPLEAPVTPIDPPVEAQSWDTSASYDDTAFDEPPAPASMPAWDTPPREPVAVPIPAPIEPPVDADEEQWGFDEAQIEAARRADVPVSAPAPIAIPPAAASRPVRATAPVKRSSGGRFGLLIALLVIGILAGGGYFGFLWWQRQQEPEPLAQVTQPVRRSRPAVPATATVVEAPITSTTGTLVADGGIAPPTTATLPPATATQPPATATTAAVPPATTTTAPVSRPVPPRATPAPPSSVAISRSPAGTATITNNPPAAASADNDPLRARYDGMARDFAANRSGAFTVQFAIFCQPGSVTNALNAGGSNVWFLKHGARCYRTYYGRFASREEAANALANLPRSLKDPNAKVVAVP